MSLVDNHELFGFAAVARTEPVDSRGHFFTDFVFFDAEKRALVFFVHDDGSTTVADFNVVLVSRERRKAERAFAPGGRVCPELAVGVKRLDKVAFSKPAENPDCGICARHGAVDGVCRVCRFDGNDACFAFAVDGRTCIPFVAGEVRIPSGIVRKQEPCSIGLKGGNVCVADSCPVALVGVDPIRLLIAELRLPEKERRTA